MFVCIFDKCPFDSNTRDLPKGRGRSSSDLFLDGNGFMASCELHSRLCQALSWMQCICRSEKAVNISSSKKASEEVLDLIYTSLKEFLSCLLQAVIYNASMWLWGCWETLYTYRIKVRLLQQWIVLQELSFSHQTCSKQPLLQLLHLGSSYGKSSISGKIDEFINFLLVKLSNYFLLLLWVQVSLI